MKRQVIVFLLAALSALLFMQGCTKAKQSTSSHTPQSTVILGTSGSIISSASINDSSSSDSTAPTVPFQANPSYTPSADPVPAPSGSVVTLDSAAKQEIDGYWQQLYGAGSGDKDFQFYYAMPSDMQTKREAMLEKYGINFYLEAINTSNYATQWEAAYGLIQYYDTPQAKTAIEALNGLRLHSDSQNVKAAAAFTLDILNKQFESDAISRSADGSILAFSDCFESTLGGSGRLWIIKSDKLYLDTFTEDSYSCSINQAAVSPDGSHIAVNLLGRKNSWGYIISPNDTKETTGDLMDAMNTSLKNTGSEIYHEPGHGVYYGTIDKLLWKNSDTLDLHVRLSLANADSSLSQDILTGNTLYDLSKSLFDSSGLARQSATAS